MNREPPENGWVEITSPSVRLIKAAGVQHVALKLTEHGQEVIAWAPLWAKTICEVTQSSGRERISALQIAAFNATKQSVTNTLLGVVAPDDQKEVIESMAHERTCLLRCRCNKTFELASDYRNHLEMFCPLTAPMRETSK